MKTRNNKKSTAPEQPRNEPELMMRNAVLEVRETEGDAPSEVRMTVSSEEPVLTYSKFNGEYQRVYEVLDHGEGSIDLSRAKDGLVVLDRHYGDQIGLMSVSVSNRKMGGPVRFGSGERSQVIFKDAAAGIRR